MLSSNRIRGPTSSGKALYRIYFLWTGSAASRGRHCEGGGGDILPNTVRKIGKYRKYRVKSRRNTDAAFMIGYIYAYPSRVLFYLEHVCTINQPQPWQENEKRYLEFFIGTTITGARSLEETLIPF